MVGHHGHNHLDHPNQSLYTGLSIAFLLNFLFVFVEIAGAIWTNSTAILADAVHDIGDCLALLLSIVFLKISERPTNSTFSFGYKRFSALSGLIAGAAIFISSIFIIYESSTRLFDPPELYTPGMIILAIIGLIVNVSATLLLYKNLSKTNPILTWHFIEDILGWALILISSIFLHFFDFKILDPILAICFSLYIIWNVTKHLKPILFIFLQAVPEKINIQDIEKKIKNIPSVHSVHNTHIWSLDTKVQVLSTHIRTQKITQIKEAIALKKRVKAILKKFHIEHVTIEIEFQEEECYMKNIT